MTQCGVSKKQCAVSRIFWHASGTLCLRHRTMTHRSHNVSTTSIPAGTALWAPWAAVCANVAAGLPGAGGMPGAVGHSA